jgi:CheY-like chemotaxis protein
MKTILIVEDVEMNIDLLTQLLEDDYNLLVARDGAEGVNLACQNTPDLVLMDVSLPVMNGYEATRKIRETQAALPIIGLSAHAMKSDIDQAKQAGCNDYLTKPVDDNLLFAMLDKYLG